MSESSDTSPASMGYVNYNVRYTGNLEDVLEWSRAMTVPVKIFENFDGGGFNFYIFEFGDLEDAEFFCNDFQIKGDRTLWAEDSQGGIHYLPAHEPCQTNESSNPANVSKFQDAPGVVSLATEGFVPITMGQLNLSSEEQEILVRGSRFLYSPDTQADEPPPTSDDLPNTENIRQEVAALTFAYADREAAWLNRYNQEDKALEWAFKEGFYKKRFQELLVLLPDDAVEKLNLIISQKMTNLPGESTRNRSTEDNLKLIKRFRHAIEDADTPPQP